MELKEAGTEATPEVKAKKKAPAKPKVEKEAYKLVESGNSMKVVFNSRTLMHRMANAGMTYNVSWYTIQHWNGSVIKDLEDLYMEAKTLDLFDMDHDDKELDGFIKWLSKQGKTIEAKLEDQVAKGLVSFAGIRAYIKIGSLCTFKNSNGELQAIKVLEVKDNHSFFGVTKGIKGHCLSHNGSTFVMGIESFTIPAFGGTKPIKDLGIHPMEESEAQVLLERGKRYVELMKAPSYMSLQGNLVRKSYYGDQIYNSKGRVMVDIRGMKNADPEYNFYQGCPRWDNDEMDDINPEHITEENFMLAVPSIYGFSFRSKKWGEMALKDVRDISYREDAFDKLVLNQHTKDFLLSLVDCSSLAGGKDFVDGKGGGLVFLLHGVPGVGKTFTAEAISERLQRPLYMISVGELGTDAVTVETKLTEVLETAQKWNAVLLLDECDIFLEKRNAEDMERNAVVSVFLRCVEYYQGILFLTTNRVKDLDPAFFSRISLPIHYDALTATGRESIWYSHLVGHGVKSDLAEELAGFMRISDLNGRQIKNCVRLAVATAETQHRTVTSKDLTMVTNYLEDFIECSKEEVTEA